MVRRGITRIEFNGSLKLPFAIIPLPVMKHGVAQRCMCLGVALVNLQSSYRGSLCFGESLCRRNGLAHDEKCVRIRQAGISRSIVRIDVNRLTEIFGTFLEPFGRALVPVVAAFEVSVVGINVFRVTFGKTFLLITTQLQTQSLGNLFGNLFL